METSHSHRNPGLDAVRVFATFLIVVFHVSESFECGFMGRHPAGWGPILSRLDIGVPIFFVLSGFLVGRPFVADFLAGCHPTGIGRFYWRRSVRIFPAYWLALAVSAALGAISIPDVRTFAVNTLLIQTFSMRTLLSGLSQSWTLSIEMAFYLVLPPFFVVLLATARKIDGRWRARLIVSTLLVVVVFTYAFQILRWKLSEESFYTSVATLYLHADSLALGVLCAVLTEIQSKNRMCERLVRTVSRYCLPFFASSLGLWFLTTRIGSPTVPFARVSPGVTILLHFLSTASSLLLVLPFCVASPRSRLMRWTTAKTIGWLASVSYGVYLWHNFFSSRKISGRFVPCSSGGGALLQRLAFVVPVSIALGALSFHVIERPAMKWANRRRAH